MSSLQQQMTDSLDALDPGDEKFAVEAVARILNLARQSAASDVHLLPENQGDEMQVQFRVDGVLLPVARLKHHVPNIITRLKVLANLLTYRSDIPQEGRVRTGEESLEMRVSTFPTVHGEKAVVRLFVGSGDFRQLEDLGLPDGVESELRHVLMETSGLVTVCGPAGSGKTTTLYAALRHIQHHSETPRSICTLEDPVEALLPGVSQTQIKPGGELTYERGLASLMRQDPEVIMVGEIRDHLTADIVFQASLTGHLVLTSFHAGGAADAISRLSDMHIEPYVLRSGLRAVLAQRLLRRRCKCRPAAGVPSASAGRAGCERCRFTGYYGRIMVAELLLPDLSRLGRAILNRDDSTHLHELAVDAGMVPLEVQARQAVDQGGTTEEEVLRVFGTRAAGRPPS